MNEMPSTPAFQILTYTDISNLKLKSGDKIKLNFETGVITNLSNNHSIDISKLSEGTDDYISKWRLTKSLTE
jgi:hypothetical protein